MILLDTDIVIDVLREYPPAVAWFQSVANEEIVLPGFVAMELIQKHYEAIPGLETVQPYPKSHAE